MNNFRKITLGILGATILSAGLFSCSNDDATTTNNTTTEQTAMAAKESFQNPYEIYGLNHNKFLKESKCYLGNNYVEIIESLNNYTSDQSLSKDYLEKVGYNFDNSTLVINERTFGNIDLSTSAQHFIYEFMDDVIENQATITLNEAKDLAFAKEIEVRDSNFTDYDKKQLFIMLATFKHSVDFWYEYDQVSSKDATYGRKLGWLRWVAAGLVDAGAAVVAAPLTPVGQIAVAAGASAAVLIVDKVTIGGGTLARP